MAHKVDIGISHFKKSKELIPDSGVCLPGCNECSCRLRVIGSR
jgi:hypothetical protein